MEFDPLDLTNYQHPPFMFFLWYSFLLLDWAGKCARNQMESRDQSGPDPPKQEPKEPPAPKKESTLELEPNDPPEDPDKTE